MVNNRILFLGWYKTLNHSMARTPFFHIWVYVNKFLYITHQSNLCENHIQQVRFLETSATTECFSWLWTHPSWQWDAPGNLPAGAQTALARVPCMLTSSFL